MAQPYIGEIRMFAGSFAPVGWLFCQGQLLPISENEALFQLIGTTYGGDGQETFGLPNIAGRTPLHMGNGPDGVTYPLAQVAGVGDVTLTVQQIPQHSHPPLGSNAPAASTAPAGNVPATLPEAGVQSAYGADEPFMVMSPAPIGPAGGSQPHTNYMPYGCLNYIISLFGIFPSPT